MEERLRWGEDRVVVGEKLDRTCGRYVAGGANGIGKWERQRR